MKLLSIGLLTLLCRPTLMAQTTIAVITDTHVMAPGLLVNGGTAWQNELGNDRKLLDYSSRIFDELVSKFKAEKPGLLLVTGDLTKDGERLSHEYVKAGLDQLKAEGVKVLVIPGNHDIDNNGAEKYDGDVATKVETVSSADFATLYADYGYSGTVRDDNSLSYACEPVSGLVLIGIDTHTGAIDGATLDWACQQARDAYRQGKQVIAMMHHPLFPHILGADMFVNSSTVANYKTVRNRLADAGVRVVLSGHFHTSDIAKDWNADMTKEIYDINTGSVISYPCDYRVMTLSGDLQTLEVATQSVTTLPDEPAFSNTAKKRLTASMTKIAAAKVGNALSGTAANVFVVHAEGNEDESGMADGYLNMFDLAKKLDPLSGNKISTKLKSLGLTFDSFEAILKSILYDISNYGTERADKTDDRSLTIAMPDLSEGLSVSVSGWSTYCSDRCLDLSKTDGIKGYIVEEVSDKGVQLKEVSIVPAETGFIISGEGSADIRLWATDKEADDVSGNLLKGTLSATTAPDHSYVLSTQDGTTGFYPLATSVTLPAHKAYLTIPAGGSVRQILLPSDGQATAVEALALPDSDAPCYTLQGVRVAQVQKGIYVRNGQLVVIK